MPQDLNAFRSFVKQKYPKISKSQLSQLDDFIAKKKEEEAVLAEKQYYQTATSKGLLPQEEALKQQVPLETILSGAKPKPSAEEEKRQVKYSDVEQSVNLLEKNLKEIEVSGPLAGRLSLLNIFTGGAIYPEVADYNALRKSLIGPLARAISGEVGVLTDKDIARAEGLLPKVTDAQKVRENKLKNLRQIIKERTQTKVKSRFKIEAIE